MTRDTDTPTGAKTPLQARIWELGYDQNEVATALGVTKQEMSNWCTGRITPRGPRRRKLAEFLECSVTLIFPHRTGGSGPYPQHETGNEVPV